MSENEIGLFEAMYRSKRPVVTSAARTGCPVAEEPTALHPAAGRADQLRCCPTARLASARLSKES